MTDKSEKSYRERVEEAAFKESGINDWDELSFQNGFIKAIEWSEANPSPRISSLIKATEQLLDWAKTNHEMPYYSNVIFEAREALAKFNREGG